MQGRCPFRSRQILRSAGQMQAGEIPETPKGPAPDMSGICALKDPLQLPSRLLLIGAKFGRKLRQYRGAFSRDFHEIPRSCEQWWGCAGIVRLDATISQVKGTIAATRRRGGSELRCAAATDSGATHHRAFDQISQKDHQGDLPQCALRSNPLWAQQRV